MYASASIKLASDLVNHNWFSWVSGVVHTTPGYAPLSVWISQPFALLGWIGLGSNFSILISSIFCAVLTCLLAYKILLKLNISTARAPVFIPLFFGSIIVQGLSRANYVENWQLAVTFLTIYVSLLLDTLETSRFLEFLILIDLFCLLILSKVSAPFEVWPFLVYIFFHAWRKKSVKNQDKKNIFALFYFFSLILIALTTTWYFNNFNFVRTHLKIAKMEMWKVHGSFFTHLFYWLQTIGRDAFPVMILTILLGVSFLKKSFKRVRKKRIHFRNILNQDNKKIFLFLFMLSIITSFCLLILENNSDPRFLYINVGLADLYLSYLLAQKNAYFILFITLFSSLYVCTLSMQSLTSKNTFIGDHFLSVHKSHDEENAILMTLKRICKLGSNENSIYILYDSPQLNIDTWKYWSSYLAGRAKISSSCKIYGNSGIGKADTTKVSINRISQIRPDFLITTSSKNLNDIFISKNVHNPQITTLPYNQAVPMTIAYLLKQNLLVDLGLIYSDKPATESSEYWELYMLQFDSNR